MDNTHLEILFGSLVVWLSDIGYVMFQSVSSVQCRCTFYSIVIVGDRSW